MPESNGPRGALAKYGLRLDAGGYQLVPIMRGTKRPPMDDWQSIRSNTKIVKQWIEGKYAKAGVGILTKNTPAVDLDIRDREIALKMQTFVETHFGFAPVREGFAPKRLLVFRTNTPFTKINSNVYVDEWSVPDENGKVAGHKVEILGDGQQFVAFAIHPDTGKPYKWLDKSPAGVPARDLPELNEEDGRAIVAEFERLAQEAGWTIKKQSRALARPSRVGGVAAKDDVFASDAARVEDLSEDELHAKLLLVPGCEDYDTWLQIGMALFHQFGGEDRGLELWHEWSSEAGNYDADALDAKWATFDIAEKGRAPVTARLIIKLSAEAAAEIATVTFRDVIAELRAAVDLSGLKAVCEKIKHIEFDVFHRAQLVNVVQKRFKEIADTTLPISVARDMVRFENPAVRATPRWLEGYVYVAQDNTFYSTQTRASVGVEAFNALYGRFMLTKKDVLEGKAVPEVSAAMFALNSQQIETVQIAMYLPGEDNIFWYNNQRCVNTYSDMNVPAVPAKLSAVEKRAVERIIAHFHHLFDSEQDVAMLIDAMAWIIQNPGKRMNWSFVLQGVESDGKSFISAIFSSVLGGDNVNNLAATALEEKYNAWSQGAQIAFFEEIKLHGHNRYDVLNKVKPLITNVMVPIRRMQTDIYQVVNTVSYWFTTNFRDALPIDENDTRYYPIFSRWQTKAALREFKKANPRYYSQLMDTLQHPGALRKWLLDHQVSDTFNPYDRAPDSQSKAEMISYSRSEEEEALLEILDEANRMDVCTVLLDSAELADLMSDKGVTAPYGRTMVALLTKNGFTRLGKFFMNGKSRLYWSQTPSRFRRSGEADRLLISNWLDPGI